METIFTDGQLTKLIETMRQKQMTPERFNSLLSSGILADVLDSNADLSDRDTVRAALKLGTLVDDIFRLSVDYSQSLEQMIAAGQYDWTNDSITAQRFPIEGNCVVEFEGRYFHFNRNISSENVIKEIEAADTANPWSTAKIEHVLSHGKTFPEEQRKFPIIGLGSVAEVLGNRDVPYLDRLDSERELDLGWFDDDWDPVCRFLAVRKVSGA